MNETVLKGFIKDYKTASAVTKYAMYKSKRAENMEFLQAHMMVVMNDPDVRRYNQLKEITDKMLSLVDWCLDTFTTLMK